MLILSAIFGIIASVAGYYFALWLNASVSGAMVSVLGIIFCITFCVHLWGKRKTVEFVPEAVAIK